MSTGYNVYVQEQMPKVLKTMPKKKNKAGELVNDVRGAMAKIGPKWKKLSQATKDKYNARAKRKTGSARTRRSKRAPCKGNKVRPTKGARCVKKGGRAYRLAMGEEIVPRPRLKVGQKKTVTVKNKDGSTRNVKMIVKLKDGKRVWRVVKTKVPKKSRPAKKTPKRKTPKKATKSRPRLKVGQTKYVMMKNKDGSERRVHMIVMKKDGKKVWRVVKTKVPKKYRPAKKTPKSRPRLRVGEKKYKMVQNKDGSKRRVLMVVKLVDGKKVWRVHKGRKFESARRVAKTPRRVSGPASAPRLRR